MEMKPRTTHMLDKGSAPELLSLPSVHMTTGLHHYSSSGYLFFGPNSSFTCDCPTSGLHKLRITDAGHNYLKMYV